MGEVEIDFISFVPRGANRKKYFLVKEDRALKDDILKSILETDEGDISRVMKEAGLEGEAAKVLEAASKLLKAYKDELPDGALQILAKPAGCPSPSRRQRATPKRRGQERERKRRALLGPSSPKRPWRRWTCHSGHCQAAPGGEYCHKSRGQRSQADG